MRPHGADNAITNTIHTHIQSEQTRHGDDEDRLSGVLIPLAKWPGG